MNILNHYLTIINDCNIMKKNISMKNSVFPTHSEDSNRNPYHPTSDEINELILYGDTNPDCYYVIGYFYGVNKIYDKFFEYIKMSIDKGSKKGFNAYGVYFYNIQKDEEKAIEWHMKSINENKSGAAALNMASLYENKKNFEKRDEYINMSIEYGYQYSYYWMATIQKKNGNDNEYLKYMKKGAKIGYCKCIKQVLQYYKKKNYMKYKNYLKILASYDNYPQEKKILSLINFYENSNEKKDEPLIDDPNIDIGISYEYCRKKNQIEKCNNMLENIDMNDNINALNFSLHCITNRIKKNEVLKLGTDLINKKNLYGHIILNMYYSAYDPFSNKIFEELMNAKKINENDYILNFHFGLYYKGKNDIDNALEYFLKSFNVEKTVQSVWELMEYHKQKKNYVEYVKFFKLYLPDDTNDESKNDINWMLNLNDKNLGIELLKNDLSFGMILLIKNCSDINEIKNICENISCPIIKKKECCLCMDENLNILLPCRMHKICIACYKNQINYNRNECPYCFYKFTNINRERDI